MAKLEPQLSVRRFGMLDQDEQILLAETNSLIVPLPFRLADTSPLSFLPELYIRILAAPQEHMH